MMQSLILSRDECSIGNWDDSGVRLGLPHPQNGNNPGQTNSLTLKIPPSDTALRFGLIKIAISNALNASVFMPDERDAEK